MERDVEEDKTAARVRVFSYILVRILPDPFSIAIFSFLSFSFIFWFFRSFGFSFEELEREI